MDNHVRHTDPVDNPRPDEHSWAIPVPLVITCWTLAAAAAIWTVFTDDPPGRLLIGIAALALAAYGAYGTFLRPRLAADTEGLRIRGLGGAHTWAWPQLHVSLATARRLGRDVATVEIEARDTADGEHTKLVVLGWMDLGTDPRDVLDTLNELRPGA